MTIESTIGGIIGGAHSVTESLRGFIVNIAPDQVTLILLVLAGIGGWYAQKKWPNVTGVKTTILYSLVLFLILKFV